MRISGEAMDVTEDVNSDASSVDDLILEIKKHYPNAIVKVVNESDPADSRSETFNNPNITHGVIDNESVLNSSDLVNLVSDDLPNDLNCSICNSSIVFDFTNSDDQTHIDMDYLVSPDNDDQLLIPVEYLGNEALRIIVA
ncbi:hypothetical protein J6590_039787 [Homalodisca vitripennis]|nr:hypothetical protein J6590_039787 [Homalodisca vitripennis]